MNEDWLDKIRDRMSDFETAEPDNLWESIEEKLPVADAGRHRAKRRALPIWAGRSIAAAILAAVSLLCFHILRNSDDIPENMLTMADEQEKTTGNQPDDGLSAQTTATEPATRKTSAQNTDSRVPHHDIKKTVMPLNKEKALGTGRLACITPSDIIIQKDPVATLTDNTSAITEPYRDNRQNDYAYTLPAIPEDRISNNTFSISLSGSGGTGAIFNNRSTGNAVAGSLGPDNTSWEDNPMLGILLFNQGKDIETDINHRLPVRAGISFVYNINDRFGIESGVSYTNLTSDIRKGSESNYIDGEQRLHYIGIPLNLKYRLFSWHRFEVYASAGALAEKCVSAKLKQNFILNDTEKGYKKEKLPEKPLQWSVNAAVGLKWDFVSSLGLFAEPGVSYYFKDGTDIQTIYKEKPLNFNINIGLRFTFGK